MKIEFFLIIVNGRRVSEILVQQGNDLGNDPNENLPLKKLWSLLGGLVPV